MKKVLSSFAIAAAMVFCLNAQSISVTNTFGGDKDNLAGSDFLVFDEDGNKEDVHPADRLQLDVTSDHLDSRVRLDFDSSKNADGKNTNVRTRGYVNLRPVQPLNIIAGNAFFTKWAMGHGYLVALDDNLDNSKLCGTDGAAVLFNLNGFQAAVGAGNSSKLNLNTGVSYTMDGVFAVGATAQNLTEKARSITGYAGLLSVENLTLNVGYSYNSAESDYLVAAEHAAIVSVGYTFADLGLLVGADAFVSLNGKRYDADADESVEYTDKDGDKFNPWSAAVYASYGVTEDLTVACRGFVTTDDSNVLAATIYPHVEWNTGVGSFVTGARFAFDKDDGYKGFSVPFSWKYKFKIK